VDGLSSCDCKKDVTFGDGVVGGMIYSGCYTCKGTVEFGISECFVSDSVSKLNATLSPGLRLLDGVEVRATIALHTLSFPHRTRAATRSRRRP
jgi:hypothetical protein